MEIGAFKVFHAALLLYIINNKYETIFIIFNNISKYFPILKMMK